MKNKDLITESLIEFYSSLISAEECLEQANLPVTEENIEVVNFSYNGWHKIECDPDGATSEQDYLMDLFIDDVIESLNKEFIFSKETVEEGVLIQLTDGREIKVDLSDGEENVFEHMTENDVLYWMKKNENWKNVK